MDYSKYFKLNQKVLIKTVTDDEPVRSEIITAYVVSCGDQFFHLNLPYFLTDDKDLPFEAGAEFCLLTNSFGMGVQLTAHYAESINRSVIRVVPHHDMEVFNQRRHARADVTVGVVCKRGARSLRSYRSQWVSFVKSLAAGSPLPDGATLAKVKVNLSAGGISMPMAAPVANAELCLVLLDLGDGKSPILTLCEVVWANPAEGASQMTGLRFMEVVRADQERINAFVTDELRRQGEDVQSVKKEQLDKLMF